MITVKAKFRCNSVVDTNYGNGGQQRTVKFSAAYGAHGENADYSKATPSGDLSMVIDKDTKAHEAFVPGNYYYLTFEEAPAQ